MNNNYDQNENFSGSSADSDQNGLESLEKIIAAFKKQIPIEKFSDHGLYTYEELMEMNEKQANIEAERKLRASHNRHKNELRMQTSLNKSWTFENLDTNPSINECIYKAEQFTVNFAKYRRDPKNTTAPNLIICGITGSGKSHFAGAITHRLISQGFEPHFTTFRILLDTYLNARTENGTSGENIKFELMQKIKTCELLVLDDLVTKNTTVTPFITDFLSDILRSRVNMNLSTVLTLSTTFEQFHQQFGNYAKASIQELNPRIIQLPAVNHRGKIGNYDPERCITTSSVSQEPIQLSDQLF